MNFSLLMRLFCFGLFYVSIRALPEKDVSLQVRNLPGMKDTDTLDMLGRVLHSARADSNDGVYSMNKTSLDKGWSGATLFQYSDK